MIVSRFYAEIQGNKGVASRCGTSYGMWGHIRGWHSGVYVEAHVDEKGNDCFKIYKTGGSSGDSGWVLITEISEHRESNKLI